METWAKASFWHVWSKKINPERRQGFGKHQPIYCPNTSTGRPRIDTVPRVLLESTVSLASHSLFIVVTISRKCCQATAFHDRRNCTKGRHDVDNLRSHLLRRANQSQAWQTHTRCLTNVLDVKAAYAGSHHPFPTLLFKTKYYARTLIQGAARGLDQLNFVSGDVWLSVNTCHVSCIVPQACQTKGKWWVILFFHGQQEGKNKCGKPQLPNQDNNHHTYESYFRNKLQVPTMGPFLWDHLWEQPDTPCKHSGSCKVRLTSLEQLWVGICCRVSDHEMSAHSAVQCWKQTR